MWFRMDEVNRDGADDGDAADGDNKWMRDTLLEVLLF